MSQTKKPNSYWFDRLHKQTQWQLEKTIQEAEEVLGELYRVAANRTVSEIGKLLTILEGELGTGNIRPNDLYRYNRYFEILANLNSELTSLGQAEIKILDEKMLKMYNSVQTTLDTLQLTPIKYSQVTSGRAEDVIKSIWCSDGKHWSQRVWGNIANMEQDVMRALTDCIARGVPKNVVIQELMDKWNSGYERTDMLIRTELSYIRNQSAVDRYTAAGLTEYEWICKGPRPCKVCLGLNHKKFSLAEAQAGVNLPPEHPNCCCAILPVVNEGEKG